MKRCQELIERHEAAWRDATRHPFLDACAEARIGTDPFHTWLVQDYLFVVEFTRFAGRVLAAAPAPHLAALIGGVAALGEELAWFRARAAGRSLALGVARHPTCERYVAFMEQVAAEPYTVQAVTFWAIEKAYNDAWRLPGPMAPPYDEFADRWGSPAFTDYVEVLESQADEALAGSNGDIRAGAEGAFLEVAGLERMFWQMALDTNGD